MAESRGGILGAFNTENQEALKLLTTTFEYGKMRQIFKKKSGTDALLQSMRVV
jgi:hypothetical protein